MSNHYLGLTYAVPHETGLDSEARAAGKRLAALLNSLSETNEWIFERGEFTESCWEFKAQLIKKLKADGWRVSIPNNTYRVLPPVKAKKGNSGPLNVAPRHPNDAR